MKVSVFVFSWLIAYLQLHANINLTNITNTARTNIQAHIRTHTCSSFYQSHCEPTRHITVEALTDTRKARKNADTSSDGGLKILKTQHEQHEPELPARQHETTRDGRPHLFEFTYAECISVFKALCHLPPLLFSSSVPVYSIFSYFCEVGKEAQTSPRTQCLFTTAIMVTL